LRNRLAAVRSAVGRWFAPVQHDDSLAVGELYNNAPCGYHSLDPDGVILAINDTELSWLGYRRAELVGKKKFQDLLTPGSQRAFAENFPEFKTRGFVKDLEFDVVRRDGRPFTVLLNATAIFDADQNFVASRSTLTDITDRKRAERERDRFFTLSLDLHCVAHEDGYFKRLNPAFAHTLGWSLEELLARPFLDFVHPDDRAATLREVERQVVAGESVLRFLNRYRHKDGSCRGGAARERAESGCHAQVDWRRRGGDRHCGANHPHEPGGRAAGRLDRNRGDRAPGPRGAPSL
jgi:PAS domain S-box-containing protein